MGTSGSGGLHGVRKLSLCPRERKADKLENEQFFTDVCSRVASRLLPAEGGWPQLPGNGPRAPWQPAGGSVGTRLGDRRPGPRRGPWLRCFAPALPGPRGGCQGRSPWAPTRERGASILKAAEHPALLDKALRRHCFPRAPDQDNGNATSSPLQPSCPHKGGSTHPKQKHSNATVHGHSALLPNPGTRH